jgi:1L-myo-inositol 1-phosphate cytidylyltransferase
MEDRAHFKAFDAPWHSDLRACASFAWIQSPLPSNGKPGPWPGFLFANTLMSAMWGQASSGRDGKDNQVKGVIVAAGLGRRLSPLTLRRPKPLVPVLGKPLIQYTIEAFARAGFEELGVVLGYKGEMLARYLGNGLDNGLRIRCLRNERYLLGNGTSLYVAQSFVGNEPFVVSMADNLLSVQTLSRLLACPLDRHILCVDHQVWRLPALEDATKVWLDMQGRVRRIGKHLKRWHAVDVGVFLFQPRVFRYIEDLLAQAHARCSITRVVRRLISRGDQLHTCDIAGAFWLDVDTKDDLAYARRVLSAQTRMPNLEPVQ